MEVRIGVQNTVREIVLETSQSHAQITKAVNEALQAEGLLSLEDDKGRVVIIPADRLAYVELGEQSGRKVGFGAN